MSTPAPMTLPHPSGQPFQVTRCRVVVLTGEARGLEHVMTGDLCRVGKARDNHVVLQDETVSRYHFEIVREPRGYLVRDAGSTNGTHLDGAEIREAYLKALSVVTAGTVQVKLRSFVEKVDPAGVDHFGDAVGTSEAARSIFGLLARLAPTETTLLLQGEAGTGKDLLARTVAAHSPRATRPFVRVDCTGPAEVLDAELFGADRTVAGVAARAGAFEAAHRGVLYLDEVGALPMDLQVKLARALASREVRRGAGPRSIRTDVRVLASTRLDLTREVERGKFVPELLFRLGARIEVPALRAAPEDFEPGRSFRAEKVLWEEDFERRYLLWLLRRTQGNISQAARDAQMDRKYLHKLLKKHSIETRLVQPQRMPRRRGE